MTRNPKKNITIAGIIVVVVLLVGYTLFQAKNLIRGPVLTIETPKDGATLTSDVVPVQGSTENISAITLNDSPIFIDKNGNFKETFIAPYGYSVVKLSAKDRFGTVITKYLHLVLLGSPASMSTSTSASSTNVISPVATTSKK